jgi:poly-gamma-glutamate capsule biosynthesis protein CapA/YwtB (metallophosphatase superfamily)
LAGLVLARRRERHRAATALIGLLAFVLTACGQRQSAFPTLTLAAVVTAMPASATVTQAPSLLPVVQMAASDAPGPPATGAPPTATTQPPTPEPAATATPPTIRLLFTGDINPGRCPAQRALRADDFTLPYHKVADVLRAADLTVGSLDGSISDESAPSPCPLTMNLIGPARTVEGLNFAGFDVITVATNHAKDCGARGWNCDDVAFRDTLLNLRQAGLLPVGGGENLAEALAPVIVEVKGVRFAFIGVTSVGMETWARDDRPGTAPLSDAALPLVAAAIGAARQQADVVIVLAQWGVEYTVRPDDTQLRWAPLLIGAGADLVIGNHPHVVEPVEVFAARDGVPGGVVAYALGNFIFDQGPWETRQGVVFEAAFTGPALTAWDLLPVHIYSLHQPDWAPAEEAKEILERVEAARAALPER